jgi:glucose-1-phosphate cytidylyltransferase
MMKYYAYHGHDDFILCLGYGAAQIKRYFLEYNEWESNDFVLSDGARRVELLGSDVDNWRITFVDTGPDSVMGERLRRVRHLLENEETFLVNYADCLTDCDLELVVDTHRKSDAVATMLAVPPTRSFHVVEIGEGDMVDRVGEVNNSGMWINGGYMVMGQGIFDVLQPNEELVYEPFGRLAERGRLAAYRHTGNWLGVDTFKERQDLEEIFLNGKAWWAKWEQNNEV